jgi:integrase
LLIRTPAFATRRYPGLSLTDAADRAEADGAQRIAPNTVNSYLQNLTALFNWAAAEELLAKSPAVGLVQKSRPNVKRRGFAPDELTRLFAALAPFAAGPDAWKFWVPALALYSGARAGELTALRTEDLRVVHGIHCMAFSEFDASGVRIDGKRLKTKTSERVVPIHQAVLDAGLLAYAGSQPKPDGLLFPTLPAGEAPRWRAPLPASPRRRRPPDRLRPASSGDRRRDDRRHSARPPLERGLPSRKVGAGRHRLARRRLRLTPPSP